MIHFVIRERFILSHCVCSTLILVYQGIHRLPLHKHSRNTTMSETPFHTLLMHGVVCLHFLYVGTNNMQVGEACITMYVHQGG
jgi:hypothetical protein